MWSSRRCFYKLDVFGTRSKEIASPHEACPLCEKKACDWSRITYRVIEMCGEPQQAMRLMAMLFHAAKLLQTLVPWRWRSCWLGMSVSANHVAQFSHFVIFCVQMPLPHPRTTSPTGQGLFISSQTKPCQESPLNGFTNSRRQVPCHLLLKNDSHGSCMSLACS